MNNQHTVGHVGWSPDYKSTPKPVVIGELMPVVQRRLVLPAVAGRMEGSNADFEHRCLVYLAEEQDKLSPDNGLIALLCDGVRLAREYSAAMQSGQNACLSHGDGSATPTHEKS